KTFRSSKFATDSQRTITFETLRRGAAVSEHFVYRVRRRADRADRPKWFGQVDVDGDTGGAGESGYGGRGAAQACAVKLGSSSIGICSRRYSAVGDRKCISRRASAGT